jgi:Tfp pilus assembly protein PilF
VREYSEVIGRDPRVASTYVGLANSYLLLREDGSMPEPDAYTRADAAAQAAVSLAPQSFEAHRALAFIAFWSRQDRATARREFAQAIAAKPDDPLTHHWFATALLANGEMQAAVAERTGAESLISSIDFLCSGIADCEPLP